MKISTKGRYALRMMLDLALHDTGEYIALKDISARQEISIKYLEQIVTMLSRVGYLRSVRGPQGGYKLAKPPAEYRIGDILRITEGSLAPVACLDDDPNECERYGTCSTIEFWEGFYRVITDYVDRFTLEDLAEQQRKKVSNNYVI